jgi:predicted transcriptional regulator
MPTPVAVKLDADVQARIKALGIAKDRSPHWMMREAIAQYVAREEKREAFRQDGLRAWEAYQDTGLHVTQSEADAWLAKLADGEDQDPPTCHV